jgi:hypothetical protein
MDAYPKKAKQSVPVIIQESLAGFIKLLHSMDKGYYCPKTIVSEE